jgi:transposase
VETSPESPDFNPIENLWHELKEYIRREVKPKTKAELIEGFKAFWATVTVEKCTKYIGHLHKVITRAVELNGDATGY